MPAQPKGTLSRVTAEPPSFAAGARPTLETAPAAVTEPPQPRRGRWLLTLMAAVVLVAGAWALAALRGRNTATTSFGRPRTATVERRDFVRTLRLAGTTEAVEFYAVIAPALAGEGGSRMVITKLARAGFPVKKGDLLAEFDRQAQIRTFLDKQAEYRDLEDQIQKKKSDNARARANDETVLKQAENDLEKAKLEMLKNEVVSRIDAEKNKLAQEENEARLKQLRETFELKRRAAEAEIRILEIQKDRARSTMLHAQQNSEKMTIRSPLEGLVVLNNIWKSGGMGEPQEGDEVWPGFAFMQVVNPSSMQVRAQINQIDFPFLQPGQPARIHLDAYPQMEFTGKLERLSAIGTPSGMSPKMRTFQCIFSIRGSDPKLMPDLSAAVDVELERRPNALVAPRDAVLMEKGQAYIQVKSGLGFNKRRVTIGPRDDTEVVVESGLDAGAVVLRDAGTVEGGL